MLELCEPLPPPEGLLKDAERVYLIIDQPDLAITMYKEQKHYDQLIRLVTKFHEPHLNDTHIFLGKSLEEEGKFKDAEYHYVEGKDWKSAVNMYCTNAMFEEAFRVCMKVS